MYDPPPIKTVADLPLTIHGRKLSDTERRSLAAWVRLNAVAGVALADQADAAGPVRIHPPER